MCVHIRIRACACVWMLFLVSLLVAENDSYFLPINHLYVCTHIPIVHSMLYKYQYSFYRLVRLVLMCI